MQLSRILPIRRKEQIMILVVGATGMVGSEICRVLSERKIPFKAMVRTQSDSSKVENLKKLGVELAFGDVRSPETLKAACQGVEVVICTISSMPFAYQAGQNDIEKVDLRGVIALIDAAKASGVKHMIYTSFSKNMDQEFPLRNAKRAVEKLLKESGLLYTILRPSYFIELWLSPAVGFDTAKASAQIYGTGNQPISWISYKDVARFAVEAVTNPAARNAVLELGGLEKISPHQIIKLYEQKLGQPFHVTYIPVEALQGQYQMAEDPMQKSFIGLMISYAGGDPIEMEWIQKTFAVRLTSLENFVNAM